MPSATSILGTLFDLLLVVLGFGAIIFLHELGHFLAARWAGIRVLAFAIGFGPAAVSWRRGLGFRKGSSEREYLDSLPAHPRSPRGPGDRPAPARALGHTEYRLNWLPFGGYVKMLGQDDLDPAAVSDAPDSYQQCPPWKRMVVISAGVVANVITAAILFAVVFLVGLRTEPPIIGEVVPGHPGSRAVPLNARQAGVDEPGLKPGDEVLSIDTRRPRSFNDLVLAAATARRGRPVNIVVRREGVATPLEFAVTPEQSPLTGLLEFGIEPVRSGRIVSPRNAESRRAIREALDAAGLVGIEPGMTLVSADGSPTATADSLSRAVRLSGGRPVHLVFHDDAGTPRSATITPAPEFERALVPGSTPGSRALVQHLLGLTPVMTVAAVTPDQRGYALGLREGDLFARVGSLEFPSIPEGMAEIKRHKGRTIDLVVLRDPAPATEAGVPAPPASDPRSLEEIALRVPVRRDGTIGFYVGDAADRSTIVALPPPQVWPLRQDADPVRPPAAGVITRPGSRILSVDGRPVSSFADLRAALLDATRSAPHTAADTDRPAPGSAVVRLRIELPLPPDDSGARPVTEVDWPIPPDAVAALHTLAWHSPLSPGLFELRSIRLRADGPLGAVWMGVAETRRVMITTYVTFARLFERTVRIEHLKGPVGIAHLGTLIADRGLVWLLFFMGLISVNLAVVNFLPLPIADGGQFIMLLFEQARGRPVPIPVQNAITAAGLVLIGALFLLVTFNDVKNLLGV